MDDDTSNDAPQASEFSDRQLQVWRALRAKSRPDYPFNHWYAGALWALKFSDHDNPDRLAHAGNSLREPVEKLPRALGTEIIGPEANFLKQNVSRLELHLFRKAILDKIKFQNR